MSSGFTSSGGPDFFTGGGITNGRSTTPMIPTMNMAMNNLPPQLPYRSAALAGILPEPASQRVPRGPEFIGKRSLAEFQQHHHQLLQQQQMGGLGGLYCNLRNVKPRVSYQQTSPISPLSPVDFSVISSLSPEISSISNSSSPMNPRYGLPIIQQLRPQQQQQRMMNNIGNIIQPASSGGNHPNKFVPNLLQNQRTIIPILSTSQDQTEKKMMNRLQELEKQLLDDEEEEEEEENGGGSGVDTVSAVTNSEWSDTIQNLNMITTNNTNNKAISPSPTSSSSSCSSTSASPQITCPKQSITDVATAISEGKMDAATEILTRLSQVANARGTSQQRLTAYMVSALRSRVNPTDYPPPVSELYSMKHTGSTQMLYEVSPSFKLGFMAANLAIVEAVSGDQLVLGNKKLHVIDFDVGQGGQYVHLLHALAAKKADKPSVLKITSFVDFVNGGEGRLKVVGDTLKVLANKIGVCLIFKVMSSKICDLSRENLGVESDEALAVNLAFRLYKLPDESVTTENLRDELLRRVKGLSPKVVTVVEQEMNANTAPFVARVNEACGYYGVLFDSLDAARDHPDRLRIEEGLGRKMANSLACEGRDRVERCEVFGKWRARMSMAGFELKPMSPPVADSLRCKLNSGNPGFSVNEQSGGICFGWKGRTLTVASAWR